MYVLIILLGKTDRKRYNFHRCVELRVFITKTIFLEIRKFSPFSKNIRGGDTRKVIFGCRSRLQSCNTLCSCRKKTSHGTMENNIGCSDLTFSFHLDRLLHTDSCDSSSSIKKFVLDNWMIFGNLDCKNGICNMLSAVFKFITTKCQSKNTLYCKKKVLQPDFGRLIHSLNTI